MNKLIKYLPVLILVLAGIGYCASRPLIARAGMKEKNGAPPEIKMNFSEAGLSPIPLNPNIDGRKARLGYELFLDNRFSKNNTLACGSCHNLERYGSDNKPFSIGIGQQVGDANAPTVFNSALNFRQFWDGRATSLNEQIDGPVHNPKELGTSWPEIEQKLSEEAHYRELFQAVYGRGIDRADIIDALAVFESALLTPNAPFDKYLRGDRSALTFQQIAGFKKFQKFGCVACHQGINVGGNMFQTLGVMGDYFADRGGSFASDAGRFTVTHQPSDLHVFRVPSLRNVAQTAPYFHDGQVKNLEQAVRLMGKYQLGRDLSANDISDLISFLNALTGEKPKILSERGVASEKAH